MTARPPVVDRTFVSDLGVEACREAIRGAAKEETLSIDSMWAATPVYRVRGDGLDVRFKHWRQHVQVHTWFELHFAPTDAGGTTISVHESLGFGRACWPTVAVLVAFLWGGPALTGHVPHGAMKEMAWVVALFLGVGVLASLATVRGDRERLSTLLVRLANARAAL